MSVESLFPLFLFVLVSTVSPGGATTLATASGANFGFRRSIPLIAGIALGLGVMGALAAAGLASLLLAIPSLQLAMKAAGSAYLLWLAWQIANRGAPHRMAGTTRPTSLAGGVWMLMHNPKGWAMTIGAAASFSALANGTIGLALLLGATFALFSAISLSAWCAAGLLLARLLRTDMQWRALNIVLGLLLAISILPIWL